MTKSLDEIWNDIAQQRANYESIIAKASETITTARKLIADAREGLDALPVQKTRRARVKSLVKDSGYGRANAKVLVDEEMDELTLPSAAELFPHGIERTGGKS